MSLTFRGWQRSGIYDLPDGSGSGPRVAKKLTLTLSSTIETRSDSATFLLMGPDDVIGLQPGAITRTYPPNNARGVETTKCIYAEFAAGDLPWRFSRGSPVGSQLSPWIVLIVGTPDELFPQADGAIKLKLNDWKTFKVSDSARWAHIQEEREIKVARLISQQGLSPNQNYIAAIVPVGDPNSWPTGTGEINRPLFYSWQFQTGEAGDFVSLAERLNPAIPDAQIGKVEVNYKRVTPQATLTVHGALGGSSSTDVNLPGDVALDLATLIAPQKDDVGRPIIGLPHYGDEWVADPESTSWGLTLNRDPGHRAIAGLGLWAGIELQEMIASAAVEQTGALDIAAQRIRNYTFGAQANRSLWLRRLPIEPNQRLLIFGPSLRRIATSKGPVLNQIAGGERPLPPNMFSTAARRALSVPALRNLVSPLALVPANLLSSANRCPSIPPPNPPGLPHVDSAPPPKEFATEHFGNQNQPSMADLISKAINNNRVNHLPLLNLLADVIDHPPVDPVTGRRDSSSLSEIQSGIEQRADGGVGIPSKSILDLIDSFEKDDEKTFNAKYDAYVNSPAKQESDDESLLKLGKTLLTGPPNRPCQSMDLRSVAAVLTDNIDPTLPTSFIRQRALSGITGLGALPVSPPEVCIGLDLPVWRFLRDRAPDWLLPGLERIEPDSVIGLESNRKFIDAFMLGINKQALNELRWRNIGVASKCTPIKMFWGQLNSAGSQRERDILGVEAWAPGSDLGNDAHRNSATASGGFVLVIRGELLGRYPETVIYLVLTTGPPDWRTLPVIDAATRLLPSFQGSLGDDITFFLFDVSREDAKNHWVVLEESPHGYSFFNQAHFNDPIAVTPAEKAAYESAKDGVAFARAAFAKPLRVFIPGEKII